GQPPARLGYGHYLTLLRQGRPSPEAAPGAFDAWARTVLKAHGQFQMLCALRRGPWGVEGLNHWIAHTLLEAQLIDAGTGWYLGRPVLVTRNDYGLGLMNGDIGVTLVYPGAAGQGENLRVAFPAGDGQDSIKWVLPSRLQAVETVYALTVHKSQGSEFTHVALVLPEHPSPILTRELLYTGITRARHYFTLVRPGGEAVLDRAVQRQVLRASGLMADEDPLLHG
ncbi:MAG: ATP-binding domain-containing protein, partial [Chromatiaceae bacterium]|nr:ATP-binding domain-containing protein [Chromatiaceae bacterium]